MSSVQERYEEFVGKEDTLIRSVRTCEQAMALLKDELVYKHRGETCQETLRDMCEWIQQREEKLRREMFRGTLGNDRTSLPIPLSKQTSGSKSTVIHFRFSSAQENTVFISAKTSAWLVTGRSESMTTICPRGVCGSSGSIECRSCSRDVPKLRAILSRVSNVRFFSPRSIWPM